MVFYVKYIFLLCYIELNNCFQTNDNWIINIDLLKQYNNFKAVFTISKGFTLPKQTHLLYVLGLAQNTKGGKSFHGSKVEGVKVSYILIYFPKH